MVAGDWVLLELHHASRMQKGKVLRRSSTNPCNPPILCCRECAVLELDCVFFSLSAYACTRIRPMRERDSSGRTLEHQRVATLRSLQQWELEKKSLWRSILWSASFLLGGGKKIKKKAVVSHAKNNNRKAACPAGKNPRNVWSGHRADSSAAAVALCGSIPHLDLHVPVLAYSSSQKIISLFMLMAWWW